MINNRKENLIRAYRILMKLIRNLQKKKENHYKKIIIRIY